MGAGRRGTLSGGPGRPSGGAPAKRHAEARRGDNGRKRQVGPAAGAADVGGARGGGEVAKGAHRALLPVGDRSPHHLRLLV